MNRDDTPPQGIQISSDAFVVIVERLARIETTLESIRRDRDEMQRDWQKSRDDHEGRIRNIERWKYMLPPTLITSLTSLGVVIFGQLGK